MYLILLIISFALSFFLTDLFIKKIHASRSFKKLFKERVKLHKRNIPKLGGIAVYAAFFLPVIATFIFRRGLLGIYDKHLLGLIIGSTLMLVVGVYDDLKKADYKLKFFYQITAILCAMLLGYRIDFITNPFTGESVYIGILGYPLLALWFLAIINAVNIIDGLDGLACGIVVIASLCFFITSVGEYPFVAVMAIALCGACLGFLRFNFYPAKIFLGDTGSLFVGFILAALSIHGSIKKTALVALAVPVTMLLIPIGSVSFTFFRRIKEGKNPFVADAMHIHYRLLRVGLSHRTVVLIFYAVSLVMGFLGLASFFLREKYHVPFIVVAIFIVLAWYLSAMERITKEKTQDR